MPETVQETIVQTNIERQVAELNLKLAAQEKSREITMWIAGGFLLVKILGLFKK